jgi:hypothetical protein
VFVEAGTHRLDPTLKIMSSSLDNAGPLQRILHILAEKRVSHNKRLKLADQMEGSLYKIAFANSVKAYSSKRSKSHMITVCNPDVVLNQVSLEDFRVMCIDDSTVELFEVEDEELEHTDLHQV